MVRSVICLAISFALAGATPLAAAQTRARAWGTQNLAVNPPLLATGIDQIDGGTTFGIALRSNGKVMAWGNNAAVNAVPADMGTVKAIAGGSDHAVALLADGTVRAWGNNSAGQTNVPAGLDDVVAIASSSGHTLALKTNHTVVAWGSNSQGQSTIPPGLADVVAIGAGAAHSLAVKADGSVVAWGLNTSGQCNVPVGLTDVVAVTAGFKFSVALKADGTVVAWGSNEHGRLDIPAGLNDVKQVSAGLSFTLALKSDGTVVGWGSNFSGESTPPENLRQVSWIGTGAGLGFAVENTANHAPIARAGADQTVVAHGAKAKVSLDGSASSDADADAQLTFTWREGATILGSTATMSISATIGRHFYELTVTDDKGGVSRDYVVVEVLPPAPVVVFASLLNGDSERFTVTLPEAAPAGGKKVALTTTKGILTVPPTIVVLAGSKIAHFTATAPLLDSEKVDTIQATTSGHLATQIAVSIRTASLARIEVPLGGGFGGTQPTCKIILNTFAGPSGVVVDLQSTNPLVASVPTSVTVSAGARTETFRAITAGVDTATSATLQATYAGVVRTSILDVLPARVRDIVPSAPIVTGGNDITGNLARVFGKAGPSGVAISLFSSDTAVATVPASLTIAPGNSQTSFKITTSPVASPRTVTIFAVGGGASAHVEITVSP